MTRKVDVSSKSIVFTILFLTSLWFLYQVRSIIVMLFISFILMTAINPLVRKTRKYKIPPIITVLFIFIFTISLLAGAIASLTPAVIQQTKGLSSQLPSIIDQLNQSSFFQFNEGAFSSELASVPSNILKIAAGAFSNIINLLAIFFMTYYLILDRDNLHEYLVRFFGDGNREKQAEAFVENLERKIGGWLRGQLILMLAIGVFTYIGLLLLGIPYALPLAIIAGILEIIPNIGPILAAIPAILIGLAISPITALGVLAFNVLIQQLEANLLVPRVMEKVVGTKPLVTITVLFTGFTLAGIMGAILAMPIYLVVETMLQT